MAKKYIDAEAFAQRVEQSVTESGATGMIAATFMHFAKIVREDIPAADVEPVVRGVWVRSDVDSMVPRYDCSECHTIGSPTWKRCPVCEAKMHKDFT